MEKLTLKGCTLKEKLDFIEEIGLNKNESPAEYRQLMGWHTKETEYLFFKFRESQLEKRIHDIAG